MRAAVVGCGAIAQVHARSLAGVKECEIAGFADIAAERAQAFAARLGGRAYGCLEEMLAGENPDVLHICTPHYLHVPMAVHALERGIHVLMEKPPAISREQYRELKQAVGQSDKKLGFCFQNRYNDSVRIVKQMLESGACGAIRGARGLVTWSRDEAYYTQSGWRGRLSTEGGGVLINQAVHTLDLLCCFLGRPVWVDAGMANHHLKGIVEVEDTMEAYIRYENAAASFYATTAYCDDAPPIIDIACERATIRIEEPRVTIFYKDGRVERPETAATDPMGNFPMGELPMGKSYWGSGHAGCIADFYDCLRTGRTFPAELAGVEDSLRLLLAVYESARGGRAVSLAEETQTD